MVKTGTLSKFAGGLLGLAGLFCSFSGMAEEKRCECHFSAKPWEAFGSRAACTAWTTNGSTSCNIAFGGLGTSAPLVQQLLKMDPAKYAAEVSEVLPTYLVAFRANDVTTLTDRTFLSRALPIFMRAALLQGSRDPAAVAVIATLNISIQSFVDGSSEAIAKVFRGEADPFNRDFSGARFQVGKGWIQVEYKETILVTTYMPGE